MIWCQSGSVNDGLDDFELAAVLGRRLHLDIVAQAVVESEKRVVALGTLREERLALSFIVPDKMTDQELVETLDELTGMASPSLLFMSASRAAAVAHQGPVVDAIRRFESPGALALWVPVSARENALRDPQMHFAALRGLARAAVRFVRFEDGVSLDAMALDEFMRTGGLACDCSVPVDCGVAAPNRLVRDGAYAGASPYRPQPFDLRVPWASSTAGTWIELPALSAADADAAWVFRQGPPDDQLWPLLNGDRMESFDRLSRLDPSLEAQYDTVRIYNWPQPAPAIRVTLFDGGEASPRRVIEVTAALRQIAAAGPRARIVDHHCLLADAWTEASARYHTSSAGSIEIQHEAHTYLAQISRDAPLRLDYADFARFAPPTLGDALEIGSGYGVLAWALSPRAQKYVRLDLDPRMFRNLRSDLGQAGAIADIHRLPFKATAFDTVIANNVIEHFHDPMAGLAEIRRVLRANGRLVALVPFDALNSRHELPAHHWKIDRAGLELALKSAGFEIARLDVINLHEIGVSGAFPSCLGYAAMVDAVPQESAAPAIVETRRVAATSSPQMAGRLFPSVRELVGFERWNGKQVVAIEAPAGDADEFVHFRADVRNIDGTRTPWPVPDRSADLVYSFLSLSPRDLPVAIAEMRRVLTPGGIAVSVFRNRHGLRYLSRIRSYFGEACDLTSLIGADALVRLGDDDGARHDEDYATVEEVEQSFREWRNLNVSIRNLTPDDLQAPVPDNYGDEFWDWLSQVCGRFILVKAEN